MEEKQNEKTPLYEGDEAEVKRDGGVINIRLEKTDDNTDFKRGVVVGAAGLCVGVAIFRMATKVVRSIAGGGGNTPQPQPQPPMDFR